jgi:hypothetical protein
MKSRFQQIFDQCFNNFAEGKGLKFSDTPETDPLLAKPIRLDQYNEYHI